MTDVFDALMIWRNEDHEDNRICSRHEIITLLVEIERLTAALREIADLDEDTLKGSVAWGPTLARAALEGK